MVCTVMRLTLATENFLWEAEEDFAFGECEATSLPLSLKARVSDRFAIADSEYALCFDSSESEVSS